MGLMAMLNGSFIGGSLQSRMALCRMSEEVAIRELYHRD